MRKGSILGVGVVVVALLLVGGGWYVQGVNQSHPAEWPMVFGDATGKAATRARFPQRPQILWAYPLPAAAPYPPVIDAAGILYVATGDQLIAVGADGQRKWAWKSSDPVTSVALGRHDMIYALSTESLAALSTEGRLLWMFPLSESRWVAPPLVGQGGVIYLVAESQITAVASDGTQKWAREWDTRSLSTWPVITADGLLLVVEQEDLLALRSDGSLAWSMRIQGARGNSIPVVVDGENRIYVRGPERFYVLDSKGRIRAEAAVRPSPSYNLSAGKGFVQDSLVRWLPDGTRQEAAETAPLARGQFTYLDSLGDVLFIDRKERHFEYVLRSAQGVERWRLAEIRGQSLPAIGGDGRICVVGTRAGESSPALLCIGESQNLP